MSGSAAASKPVATASMRCLVSGVASSCGGEGEGTQPWLAQGSAGSPFAKVVRSAAAGWLTWDWQ